MKKQELIKIIELVVRKEVKKQVNEIFIKENNKTQEPSLTELVSEPINEVETKPKKEVHYTDNQELNKVLNETAGGIPQGDSDYPTMSGGIYDTSRMSEMLGYGNLGGDKETKRKVAAVDTIKKAGVDVDQVPDHVQNALTKDYSKVMKAIDQKKNGGYRP
jgi:hypothetical protein|tara:strand:+ start:431 stop:913 length:483 start_codon:yes stop_codon:yes gene_type:complete